MVSTLNPTVAPEMRHDRRVVFHHISWQAYEQILEALGDHRHARLAYDQGTLEIRMPLEGHENASDLIGILIRILIIAMGLKVKTMGSTTLNRSDLKKGVEPDKSFYIQNQPLVAGKTVNLAEDPAPDLVLEVDITHTDVSKPRIYAALGVPEFWRYNGQVLQILHLQNQAYVEVENSPTFPWFEKAVLYQFLQQCQTDEVEAEETFRAWVKQQIQLQSGIK
jgi:Uma2 family endonuclease